MRLGRTIGSTVATVLAIRNYIMALWVGDSRVYRLRGNRLEQITRDHSQVEELVALGELTRAEVANHPMANVITRAVGGSAELRIDANLQGLHDRDRLLLCSDGLHKDLTDDEMVRRLGHGTPADAVDSLVELALARGGKDNITAVVVDFARLNA